MTVKVLGIIPARFASTRFPGKPLVPIFGKPLIQHTFENVQKASIFDQILIATDDSRIEACAKSFGAEVIMTSSHCLNGSERLAEVLTLRPMLTQAEVIVNIQGDEPCIDPRSIESAVQKLLQDSEADVSTLITPLLSEDDARNPSVVKCVKDLNDNALYFSRSLIPSSKSQKFHNKGSHYKHIGLYVYRPHFLLKILKLPPTPLQMEEDLEQLKILEYGYRIKVAITPHSSIGVDTPEDIQKLERWLCTQNSYL